MKPQKLSWVTTPLLIMFILQLLGLAVLPFLAPLVNSIANTAATDPTSGITADQLGLLRVFTGATLWVSFIIAAAWAAFTFLTYRAMGQGRGWARVAAIVIAILGLLNFPIGTILGVLILIGAFDPDVQRFASR
ncbi:hypothetical protein [Deinococcus puniceus]|uniref:DUF4064 domain-containing protein n=1 Tax=Deinococcus puniceus TaxID=1182568 RepID=A0A172TB87_9DEIO|nr:hypothetical protein [Deinococcus puniceus]ANE44278.1 hypothetical protein SU48_11450 [Deinococcus puniceus]